MIYQQKYEAAYPSSDYCRCSASYNQVYHIPFIAPLVLQNTTMNHSQYLIATDVTAGHSIDANRTNGDVIIKNGINYEIEASGIVRLDDGFKVEKGGRFAVYPSAF